MKFSELINLRNHLAAMSGLPIKESADLELNKISNFIETHTDLFGELGQEVIDQQTAIQQSFDNFEKSLVQLQTKIKNQTETAEKEWFQESYKLYESLPFIVETPDYIFNRRPELSEEVENLFKSRIKKQADWHYSAMIIRPGIETFINDMVAYDPLYLVDEKHELLAPTMDKFNKLYQRRLRPYVVNERSDDEILGKLPNDQFGMCLVYNYFNYRPFEVIKRYLIEIYQKLKPGGILIMTFNDCDRVSAVRLVENNFCSYTPGYLVRELGESLGYEIEFSWNDPGPSTWIEFKKPGVLKSLRGGQALAKIMTDSDVKFENNKELAARLGIGGANSMNPQQLQNLIEKTLTHKK
jgi:SAM-dependent methyltransferase